MNQRLPVVSMRTMVASAEQDRVVKRSTRTAGVVVACALSFQMVMPFIGQAAAPGGSSSAKTSGLRPAEYCTVFLAPKLGEKLNLDVVQRVVAAMLYETALDDAGGARAARIRENNQRMGFDMPNTFQDVTEDSILLNLDRSGTTMRDALKPAQIAAFEKMFKAREIAPIGADMGPTPGMFVVRYTRYGEEKERDNPSSAKAIKRQGDMRMIAAIRNLDEALEVLNSSNKQVNLYGLEWLTHKARVPNDGDRARVLAALQESLNFAIMAPYQAINIDCIELFCAWADRTQTKRLQQLCQLRGKANEAREIAVGTLIKLDPDAAVQLIRDNRDPSFRTEMKRILEKFGASTAIPADVVAKLSALIEESEAAALKPAAAPVVPPRDAPATSPADKPVAQTPPGGTPTQQKPVPPPPAVTPPPKPEPDTTAILAGLQSGDDSQVIRALMNSIRLTQADDALAAAVIKVLRDSPAVTHRILAARALERWGKPDAIPALEEATKDKNGMLKGKAQQAINAINARKTAQP